jgi:hypothetical protein
LHAGMEQCTSRMTLHSTLFRGVQEVRTIFTVSTTVGNKWLKLV